MKIKTILILIAAALIIWFIFDSFSQPGPQDLEGDFKEIAMYRNENNTGPIVRVYAITVTDTLWQEMQQYGDFMPHTKYGNTKVYFFRQGSPVPQQVTPGEENIAAAYQEHCLARYEKDAMGQVSFVRQPFQPKN
ncbi:hypothetical protein FVR03_03295 [Pontibacter qinzhouensis]|uniref:Uncharacterized protein n=1 Tax=Pontibacter qinzhouensis TaxID=2603253 RepID=A0A5C8KCT0_9BACT|nr:hypothetical protein [Pontibacter qinzhouensis]TXK51569.1 hypothetical protein FVR03_03295 [Pontibacter qinzhouensis]